MVGSFFGNSVGQLTFNLILAPPLVQIDLAVDSRGGVSPRNGSATLRGTVTCTGPAEVNIDGSLKQRAGCFFLYGSGSTSISCDGTTPWSFEVLSFNGRFTGGRTDAEVSASSYENDSYDYETATVRLNGSNR